MKLIKFIKNLYFKYRQNKRYKKKLKELKKRDPFIYKNF